MTRKLLVGVLAAGALTVTAGTAFAMSSDDTPTTGPVSTSESAPTSSSTSSSEFTSTSEPTSSSSPTSSTSESTPTAAPAAGLSADDAGRIVTDRVGGTVREIEREEEHGRIEWKVEVTTADGNTYDVRVDAQTGAVTRVDQDDRGGHGDDDRGGDDRGGHGGDDRGGDDRGGDDHGGHGGHGHDDH